MTSFPSGCSAMLFGASGGIGQAMAARLDADPRIAALLTGSRRGETTAGKRRGFRFDLEDEASIAAAAALAAGDPPRLVIVATGMLHDAAIRPERAAKMQSEAAYHRLFAVNAIGPALIAKHLWPILPRDGRVVFAALSAKVGSIEDNRLGGWHAYRASKAALNMIVRTCAIELARHNPQAIAVTLHPGTVDTALSAPFQRNVDPARLFAADDAAQRLLAVIDRLGPADHGRLIGWDGQPIPF